MFDYKISTHTQKFDAGYPTKLGMSVLWILIIVFLYHCAWTYAQCPRQIGAHCKGPYVIRPARQQKESHQCHADQQPKMMSCMQKCQADVCCKAFGLDDLGQCETSSIPLETLYFVKETPDLVPCRCFEGKV